MIALGSLLLLVGLMGFVPVTEPGRPHYVTNKNDAFVIAVERSAGFTPAQTKAIDYYSFTVAKNGDWEFKPHFKGEVKKGKLGADDLNKWVRDIEYGGLYQVVSNPELGALDEPYMDITVKTKWETTEVRVRLSEKLSQDIEKKIVEVVKPGPVVTRVRELDVHH